MDQVSFLPEVERVIGTALEAVASQEKSLAAIPDEVAAAGTRLERVHDQICGLNSAVDRSRQVCAALDALLQAGENDARTYLEEAKEVRERLADWAGRAIN